MSTADIYTERERPIEAATERPETVEEPDVCPECGGRLADDPERAETACVECGLVVEADRIDRGPEWRAFDATERDRKARVGMPTTKLLHDKGLSSHIGWQDRDAYGNPLSARQRRSVRRLRTWDERFRTRDHGERNLKQALGEIERMGSALGLADDVRETASVIYRRALDEGLLPGRSIEGVATASIYAAARQMRRPRSIGEVAGVSRVDEEEFTRAYRYVVRELDLAVRPADPSEYVGRYASVLDLDPATEREARELLAEAAGTGTFDGKSPTGLAAAAIYAAGRLTGAKLTQEAVGDVADVSSVTIRNRYKELLDVHGTPEAAATGTAAATDATSDDAADAPAEDGAVMA